MSFETKDVLSGRGRGRRGEKGEAIDQREVRSWYSLTSVMEERGRRGEERKEARRERLRRREEERRKETLGLREQDHPRDLSAVK